MLDFCLSHKSKELITFTYLLGYFNWNDVECVDTNRLVDRYQTNHEQNVLGPAF